MLRPCQDPAVLFGCLGLSHSGSAHGAVGAACFLTCQFQQSLEGPCLLGSFSPLHAAARIPEVCKMTCPPPENLSVTLPRALSDQGLLGALNPLLVFNYCGNTLPQTWCFQTHVYKVMFFGSEVRFRSHHKSSGSLVPFWSL